MIRAEWNGKNDYKEYTKVCCNCLHFNTRWELCFLIEADLGFDYRQPRKAKVSPAGSCNLWTENTTKEIPWD